MHRLRRFFISDSLKELDSLKQDLEQNGVSLPQLHLLTLEDGKAEAREYDFDVNSLMKTDVVYSWQIGSLVGIAAALIVLLVAYVAGWTTSAAGWLPFIFLAVVLLGFCTWEAGLHGIQKPNHNFERFQSELKKGRHVFFVDLEEDQAPRMEELIRRHPNIESAGTGTSTYGWIIFLHKRLPHLLRETLP